MLRIWRTAEGGGGISASGSPAGRGAERTAAPGAAVLFPKRTRSHRDGDGRAREERRLEERGSRAEEPHHRVQVRYNALMNTRHNAPFLQ